MARQVTSAPLHLGSLWLPWIQQASYADILIAGKA